MKQEWIIRIVVGIWTLMSMFSSAEPLVEETVIGCDMPAKQRLAALAPAGWSVVFTCDATPEGFKGTTIKGIKAQFRGTAMVKAIGRDAGLAQVEEFTLWLMPLAFMPMASTNVQERIGGAFSGLPELLGSNQAFKVYYLTSSATMPTWPNWKGDIKSSLALMEDGVSSVQRKASRLECRDVRECALLGVLEGPKGRVYKLKLSKSDPKTYFVRAGDYVGEYLLDDQETGTDGKPKVALRKGNEAINLSEGEKK